MASTAEEIARLRGTRPASLKDLLVDASFSRLWRAMLVSSLGDWVGFVAVAALVANIGGKRLGGLAVAGVMMARLLPSVLFGPFAGVFADRFDRRKLMIGADISRGLLYGAMPFLPGLGYIFLVSFFIECLSLLWTPAKDASVPNLVPRRQLANANSVSIITTYGTLPLGASIFTLLTGFGDALGSHIHVFHARPEFLALWLDGITFFFSARMVWGLDLRQNLTAKVRAKQTPRLNFRSAFDEIRQGYRFLRDHPTVRAMTLGVVIAFAGVGSVISLGPVFTRFSLHAGPTGFGFLITAFGVGMAAGIAATNYLSRMLEKDRVFFLSMLGAAACLFLIASMPTIGLASLFTVPMGVAVGLTWVTGYTMLQENVSDEFRGRTFATLNVWARLALFVSLVAFPALSAALGPDHTLTIGSHVLDLSGTRMALYIGGLVVVFAAGAAGRGLKRSRLARPRPLGLSLRGPRKELSGVFIAFEGVEGAGKGTQIERARAYVESLGRQVVVTREPGGTDLGDRLRETLLSPMTGTLDPRTEALLFAATRAQHVMTVIRPALQDGKVVLCDRFIDSSIAYQGVARGLGEQDVLTLNAWATQGLFPDLVVLLHLDPEVGLARAKAHVSPDRIESEDLEFHARVADAYLKIADEHPDRFAVIDAMGTPEEVHARVREAIDRVLQSERPAP